MSKPALKCVRTGPNTLEIPDVDVDHCIYANEQVPVENSAVEELCSLLEVQKTADEMFRAKPQFFRRQPKVVKVSVSPDFHKGAGIPIGTTLVTRGMVIPQAIGNDINCGVRLLRSGLTVDLVKPRLDDLEPILRRIFFEGGRNIPLTRKQRLGILTQGSKGLITEKTKYPKDPEGIWKYFSYMGLNSDLLRTRHNGGFNTGAKYPGLDDYVGSRDITRDYQIGSIGGGNHFVEIQVVSKILKKRTAWTYGLKEGLVVVMIHSGSVNIGHVCGGLYNTLTKEVYDRFKLKHPTNGIYPLPDNVPEYHRFWTMMHNAANFAFVNRIMLGLMMMQAFNEVNLRTGSRVVYDTPHNLAWQKNLDGDVVHRKGTSPALGPAWTANRGIDYLCGEPVLIPGSMGAPSYVMEGLGNADALYSASHGAGRKLSRGKALKHDEKAFQQFLKEFRVVTPVDPNRKDLKGRDKILKKYYDSLRKEAPYAYKDVLPVVDTLRDAKIALPVAELTPLLTLKGS